MTTSTATSPTTMANYGSIPTSSRPNNNNDIETMVDQLEEHVPLVVEFDSNDAYPEATTKEQKQILKLIDECLYEMKQNNGELKVEIPLLTKTEVLETQPMNNRKGCCHGICYSLFSTSLLTLLFSIAIGMFFVYYVEIIRIDTLMDMTTYLKYYLPGIISFVNLIGMNVAIRKEYKKFSQQLGLWNQSTKIRHLIENTVESQVVLYIASKVDMINMNLTIVVDAMKTQYIKFGKDRKRYMKIDPNIQVEPPSTVPAEQELQNAKHELQTSVTQFLQDMTIENIEQRNWIPKQYQDNNNNNNNNIYYRRAVRGNLFLFLLLESIILYGTYWLISMYVPIVEQDAVPYVEDGIDTIDEYTSTYMTLTISDFIKSDVVFWILILSFEAYLFSSLYLGIVYGIKTSTNKLLKLSNQVRADITIKLNTELQQSGIQFLCRDILQLRMERTKIQLLKLIHYSYKMDMIRERIDGDGHSIATSVTSASSNFSPKSSTTTTKTTSPKPIEINESISSRWKNTISSWRSGPSKVGTTKNEALKKDNQYNIVVPAGKLGMAVDTPNQNDYPNNDTIPVVHSIESTSILNGKVNTGDQLVSIDGIVCTNMTSIEVSDLLRSKSQQPNRTLVFAKPSAS